MVNSTPEGETCVSVNETHIKWVFYEERHLP